LCLQLGPAGGRPERCWLEHGGDSETSKLNNQERDSWSWSRNTANFREAGLPGRVNGAQTMEVAQSGSEPRDLKEEAATCPASLSPWGPGLLGRIFQTERRLRSAWKYLLCAWNQERCLR
jgi:hypothetical protein